MTPTRMQTRLTPPPSAPTTPCVSADYAATDTAAAGLARRAQGGDVEAYSALVRLLSGRLYRYFRVRGFRDADAQDLVQDTVLKAHGSLARYDANRRFLPWLFTIASRLAATHYRRARPSEPLPESLASQAACPHTTLADSDMRQHLWVVARDILSADHYDALWLHYGEDLTVADVAVAMGKSHVHVKVMMHRARRQLRRALRTERGTI